MLKNLLFCFSGEPLGFSIFPCFPFFMFSFLQIFLLLIAFVYFTVSLLFVTYFVFVLLHLVLRIWKSIFYYHAFFTLHSFPTFGTICFYQGFPGTDSSALKAAGFPLRFKTQTRPICLFKSHSVRQLYDK